MGRLRETRLQPMAEYIRRDVFHGRTMGCGMRAVNPTGREITDTQRAVGRITVNPEGRGSMMADSHVPLWL